ncbi:MAG: 40S ribosomal protein S19 [Candidatus Parvarchaeota archaeon]
MDQQALVVNLATRLKEDKLLAPPQWAKFVKTASTKDRPPSQKDWWYLRGASILRRMYLSRKVTGVNRLRRVYGDKTKNTLSSHHFKPSGGSNIRHILQQLESNGLIVKKKVGVHSGRMISAKGISLIDSISKGMK